MGGGHISIMALTGQEFYEKRGYQKGTYEGQLASQGYNVGQLLATGQYGKNINPGEYQQIRSSIQSPQDIQRNTALQNLNTVASQQYQFDPNQFLPGIQQQAEGIYGPQQAQLEAIRLLQRSQYEDTRTTTIKEFDDQLRGEIESINNRGAYFSGGAIEREQDLGDAKMRALQQLDLQGNAADFMNLAQQGLLAAEEAQFIQDRLYNAESSAYARWTDQRNFSFQAASKQYELYADERNFARDVFESDRTYDQSIREAQEEQRRFELQYDMDSQTFDMAKKTWNIDIKQKKLSYEQALDKFKSTFDTVDYFPDLAATKNEWKSTVYTDDSGNITGIEDDATGTSRQYDGGTFDLDSFINTY